MRLYKRHDSDLLCLHKQNNFKLQKTIKGAVLAYLDNSDKRFDYPDSSIELASLPSTLQFNLYLSDENENDVRIKECLATIPSGYKNSFLKNLTRYYMAKPTVFAFDGEQIKVKTERDPEQEPD